MRRVTILLVFVAPVLLQGQSRVTATRLDIQAPEPFFGFRMGEDRQLAGWPEIQKYFQTVAAESDRVELVDAGPSTDGNRLIAAVISSPENIARLAEIRA